MNLKRVRKDATTLVGTTAAFSAMAPLGGAGMAGLSKALPPVGNVMGAGMVIGSLKYLNKASKKKGCRY